jgi:hypothetical protein
VYPFESRDLSGDRDGQGAKTGGVFRGTRGLEHLDRGCEWGLFAKVDGVCRLFPILPDQGHAPSAEAGVIGLHDGQGQGRGDGGIDGIAPIP